MKEEGGLRGRDYRVGSGVFKSPDRFTARLPPKIHFITGCEDIAGRSE